MVVRNAQNLVLQPSWKIIAENPKLDFFLFVIERCQCAGDQIFMDGDDDSTSVCNRGFRNAIKGR